MRPSEIHQFCLTSTRLWGSAISEPSLSLPPLKPQPAYLNASEKGVRINYSRRWPPGRKPTSFLPVLRTSRSDKGPVSEESRSSESRHPQRPSTKTPCAILRLPPCCFSSRDVSRFYPMGRLSPLSRLIRPSAWRLEPEPSTFAPSSDWSNKDMDPVPLDKRTWTMFNYVAYWISDTANAATWAMASSMLAIGLSWFAVLSTLYKGLS